MSRIKPKKRSQDGTVLLRPNALKFSLALLDQSLAQDSLAEFVRQAWCIIEPTTPLLWNWHLDAICEYLEAVASGDLTRLIVNLPPRSGKAWSPPFCGRPGSGPSSLRPDGCALRTAQAWRSSFRSTGVPS
jgi:hypothetical protein